LLAVGNGGIKRIRLEASGDAASVRELNSAIPGSASSYVTSFARFGGERLVTNGGRIYDLAAGKKLSALESNPSANEIAASPDGQWIASGCWKNNGEPHSYAGVWRPDQAAPVAKLPANNCNVFFAPDSRHLLVAGINQYTEYECGSWKQTRAWPRGSSGLDPASAAWSPDGRLLALHADEYTVRLVDAASGEEYARLTTPVARKLGALAFSPDGRWLSVLATGAGPQLWDLTLMRTRLQELGLDWK
jgi:WD40 repeat protein